MLTARHAICPGCGAEFTATDARQRYCDERCANAARVRRHRERAAATSLLDRYHEAVADARRQGILDEVEALDLLLEPRPRVLALLAGSAA